MTRSPMAGHHDGTMRAIVAEAGPTFRLASIPLPQLGAHEALVRIASSGVNPLDLKIHREQAAHARQPLPAILGLAFAGTVEAVGEAVTRVRPGDQVYGLAGGVGGIPGSLAEFAVVDPDLVAPKPANLTMREAAALPLATITAWLGLVDRMALASGETILVNGGAGGVGHVVVQLASTFGASVHATGSLRDREAIERLDGTFVDRDEPVADYVSRLTRGAGFDRVYDTAGGAALDASFAAVRAFGHVVSCLGWGTHALAPLSFKNASYSGVFTLEPLLSGNGRRRFGDILAEAATLAEADRLRASLDPRTFDLASVGAAHALLSARENRGKLVIDVARAA